MHGDNHTEHSHTQHNGSERPNGSGGTMLGVGASVTQLAEWFCTLKQSLEWPQHDCCTSSREEGHTDLWEDIMQLRDQAGLQLQSLGTLPTCA